jgi:zinc transporter ZupT
MSINFAILASISIIFGIIIFITDYYEKQHPKLNISLIAGISISYFFLVLLPEITNRIPQFPLHLELFEYFFILVGFVFAHLAEKLILQNVESKSQQRMRKLVEKENILEKVEDNIQDILTREIENDSLDNLALKDIAHTITELKKQEEEFKTKINQYKIKIQNSISEDLRNLKFSTHLAYHILVGIIVTGLLAIDLIAGILFFLFAWFRVVITYRSEGHIIFTDLEIYAVPEIKENFKKKIFLASACLMGVIIGLVLDAMGFEYTEVFFIIYSFISGVILYSIVREVLPEKEKGNPLYFIIGFVSFTIIIITISILRGLL